MIEKPECKLGTLKRGDCFMFNGEPYRVKEKALENLGMLKRKVYICRMKFADYDTPFLPDTGVYRISKGLYDLLVKTENEEEKL